MCANVTSAASSSPVASTGRSLFSRLTNPLKSRTRNLTDFHIRPLEPHRQYRPGDLVKGAVVLTVVKPIRITHLTVALHGFVRVFKHPNGVNEPIPTEASLADGNRTKSQYFGNGYASLFQDEVTLCGEGRLEAGVYEFNFELEFPSKGIPTSIDFERGTISYMITSTITRPTSITATSSCDRKISLVENVDIGLMVPPRPRTISLEPISRRPRRRKTAKNADGTSQESNDVGSGSDATRAATSPRPEESASQVGSLENNTSPRSPVPSEIHSEVSAASDHSTVSSSTGMSFRLGPVPSSAKSARNSQASGSKVSMDDKTITATIELLKSGCLPGDSLPLKITIKHTKAIKSMHGVIITLYRQGRIDSAPPLSLFMDINGKAAERLKHEEYYPKSKTGLGGLSLSSAGSSSVFRKDLSQTFAPIIVDPTTLTAVVNASVRVPEDVFPTISGVPGEMISFKYQVEVVVDLGGKLAGQQRHLPRVGTVTMPSNFANPVNVRDGEGSQAANHNLLAAWGGSIVDTDHIRREKSVVACLFEVTVGTSDSARKRGRGISSARQPSNDFSVPASPAAPLDPPYEYPYSQDQSQGHYQEQQQPYPYYDQTYDQTYDEQYPGYYSNGTYEYDQDYSAYEQYPPPSHNNIHVPPPDFQEEEGLSEKERVRRAEARLLPSQPPLDDVPGPSSSARTVIAPSAPPTIDEAEDDLYSAQDEPRGTTGPPYQQHQVDYAGGSLHRPLAPSAPPPDDVDSSSRSFASEDKQELERRRLLAEASAPSEFPDEEDHNGEGSSAREHEPSAPVLTEEDEYGGHYAHHSQPGPSSQQESLPRYER